MNSLVYKSYYLLIPYVPWIEQKSLPLEPKNIEITTESPI